MNLKCTKEEIMNLIEQYYLEMEGEHVKANIQAKKECVGFYEHETCMTTISIMREIELLGMKKEIEEVISKEKLKNILNTLLEKNGYVVTDLSYDDGVSSTWVGHYTCERLVKQAYFNGIALTLEEKKDKPLTRVHAKTNNFCNTCYQQNNNNKF